MGGKKATSTSKVSIPPEVLARYNAVNARAETAANTPFRAYGNTASDYVAQMNAQQNAGINDINATAGSYQPYMDQATTATQAGMGPAYEGIDRYMSPYIKNVADTTGAYMRQQQEQAQSGALGTAAMSGAFGGDRAGIAAANLQQQNQMGYGKTMADIMNQGYTQALGASQADLARQLQGGSQMAALGAQSQQLGLQGAQAKIAAGTMQQQTEQAGKDAMIQRFMQEQGYPFQTAQFLANIAMGTGTAQGSTTTTTTPVGIFGNLATGGRVGGYADGGGVAGPRTYSQGNIGGEGYVPVGDLPVGQLMTAQLPEQQKDDSTGKILELIASTMGAKRGGAIDQRHGYATYGSVSYPALNTEEFIKALQNPRREALVESKVARNLESARDSWHTLPANMGIGAGGGNFAHPYPPSPTTGVAPAPEVNLSAVNQGANEVRRDFNAEQFGMGHPDNATRYTLPTTTGVAAPDDDATRRILMARSLGALQPRASESYTFPTGLNPAAEYEAAHRAIASRAYGDQNPDTAARYTMPTGLGDFQSASQPRYEIPTSLGSPTAFGLPPGPPPMGGVVASARPSGVQQPMPFSGIETTNITQRPRPRPDLMNEIMVTPSITDGLASVPNSPATPVAGPQTDTGVVPQGGYNPIIPLKTQLQFVTNELQQPQYRGYLEQKYATPEQAAVQFESVYEKSGGAGNDVAAANARSIFDAARNGNLENLPPNVAEAYNHFVQNGMDPVQAAGATGRLMVESYARLDPNARNTLGGGNGTFGIAQWRADRMEDLAKFAGVPLGALTSAPVSTPEGRYYSTGAKTDGGLGGADMAAEQPAPDGGVKPYDDRNALGKFFRNPDGSINPIAFKSILGGLGAMARTNTISPISALLQGIAGGEETYNKLQNEEPKRVADIMLNSKNARAQYLTAVAMGEQRPFEQWAASQFGSGPASMFGAAGGEPLGIPQMGQVDIMGKGLSQPITLSNGSIVQGGQNYAYLTKLANDLQPYVAADVPAAVSTMAVIQDRLTDIRNSNGVVTDISGKDVKDPTYTGSLDTQTRSQFGREKTMEFEAKAIEGQRAADRDLSMINHQVDVFTQFPAGALATDKAAGLAILQSLGVPVPADTSEYAAAAQEALKGAARKLLDSVGTDAPAAEMAQLQQAIESPNMQPEAIKTILSMQKAQAEREKQYYKLRPEWNAAHPDLAMDQSAYEDWFTTQHGFEGYYQNAKKSMPIFAGELGSKQKPYALSPDRDETGNYSQADTDYNNLPPGAFYTDPNGVIKQKPRG